MKKIDRKVKWIRGLLSITLALGYPLLKEKYIPRKCKSEIYMTILKLILLYGAKS